MHQIKKYWALIALVFFFSMFINPAICILITGCLCFWFGITAVQILRRLQKKGIVGVGKILSYQVGNKHGKTPVIEFTPITGDIVTAEPFVYASTDLSKIRTYSNMIDTEVHVRYDPDDPKKFVIESETGFNYFIFTIFMLVGVIFIVVSFCNFLGYVKFGVQ